MEADKSRCRIYLGVTDAYIMRNAVDHGIEPPQEREAAGKQKGRFDSRWKARSGELRISVEMTGEASAREAIRQRAREKGII